MAWCILRRVYIISLVYSSDPKRKGLANDTMCAVEKPEGEGGGVEWGRYIRNIVLFFPAEYKKCPDWTISPSFPFPPPTCNIMIYIII